MAAPRMRTINEAAAELKREDPHTAITPHAIKQMVLGGKIPHVTVGRTRLINMQQLETYLNDGIPYPRKEGEYGKLRVHS